jgi:hypothetical protein
MPVSRNLEARKLPTTRSRVTNGVTLLPGVDGRSAWARRLRDLISIHLADLGGADRASEAELSIVRRASAITVELEHIETRFAAANEAGRPSEAADFDLYLRGANSLRRLVEAIGIKRVPRDITPPRLSSYLAGTYTEEATNDS